MGYSHYWSRPVAFDKAAFKEVVEKTKKIAETAADEHNVRLAGVDGTGDPIFEDGQIRFNGQGDEESHETFSIEQEMTPEEIERHDRIHGKPRNGMRFDFCKTNSKPYDIVVTGCLLVLKEHCPEVQITSDGEVEGDDWALGRKLVEKLFGIPTAAWKYRDETDDEPPGTIHGVYLDTAGGELDLIPEVVPDMVPRLSPNHKTWEKWLTNHCHFCGHTETFNRDKTGKKKKNCAGCGVYTQYPTAENLEHLIAIAESQGVRPMMTKRVPRRTPRPAGRAARP